MGLSRLSQSKQIIIILILIHPTKTRSILSLVISSFMQSKIKMKLRPYIYLVILTNDIIQLITYATCNEPIPTANQGKRVFQGNRFFSSYNENTNTNL